MTPGLDYHNDYPYPHHEEIDQSYAYDDSLPDVIKRSIAQANMVDPIRMVHAPDSFKQQHYNEHVSHTQMPPKAALTLAHELESEVKNGIYKRLSDTESSFNTQVSAIIKDKLSKSYAFVETLNKN